MSYAKKAVDQAIIVFLFAILTSATGYVIRLLFARNLGTENYGLFYAGIAFVGFVLLFTDLGTSASLTKFIPEFRAKNDFKNIRLIAKMLFTFQIFTSFIVGVIILLFSNILANDYFKRPESAVFIKMMALLLLFYTLERFYKFIFIGFQKPHYFTLSTFLRNVLIIVISLLFFNKTKDIYSAAFAFLISYALIIIISEIISRLKLLKNQDKIPLFWDWTLFARIMKYGKSILLVMVGSLIITHTDTLMIAYFKNFVEVGLYQAALPTAEILKITSSAFSLVMTPMAASLLTMNKKSEVKKLFELINKYFFIIIIPAGLILMFYSPLVLKILFGKEFESGSLSLAILSVSNILLAIGIINSSLFNAQEKPQIVSRFFLIAAIINLIANFVLIPLYGINGASIATLFSYLFIFIASSIQISKYDINLPYYGWLKGLFAGIIFVVLLYVMKNSLNINNWILEAIIVLTIGLSFYAIEVLILRIIKISEIKYIIRVIFIEKLKGLPLLRKRLK